MKNLVKSFSIIIAFLLATNANAQISPVALGIKGGVNLSNVGADNFKSKVGFNAGLTADLFLSNSMMLMSGLEVTTKGAKTKEHASSINAMYLQLPLHLGYIMDIAPGVVAHFDFGPYAALGIGGKTKMFEEEYNTFGKNDFTQTNILKKFDWGLGIGVGVTFVERVGIRAAYDHGLANAGNKYMKIKNRNVSLALSYLFF